MYACVYGPALAEDQLEVLIQCGYGFSPNVEKTRGDTIVLDVRGSAQLFGPPEKLCARIGVEARRAGLAVRIAVAADPDTAVLAAHGFETDIVIPPGKEPEFLAPLPIGLLATYLLDQNPHRAQRSGKVVENPCAALELWGVRTLGQFSALPEPGVFERLGPEGIEMQQLARGRRCRPLLPVRPAPGFSQSIELEHPVALRETLLFTLGSLVNQLCAKLKAQALAARELRIRLGLEKGGNDERAIRLASPTRDHRLLLKLADIEIEVHPPESAVVAVTVSADPAKPRTTQRGLFLPLSPEPEKLELHLARIAKLIGQENVGSPELIDSHRPQAFRMKHFHPLGAAAEKKPGRALAFRIFRPPLKASIRLESDIPARLTAAGGKAQAGLRGRVIRAAGPWRTSGDWWAPTRWARDEWDVQLEDGSVCRIYRDAITGTWFVEGIYD